MFMKFMRPQTLIELAPQILTELVYRNPHLKLN